MYNIHYTKYSNDNHLLAPQSKPQLTLTFTNPTDDPGQDLPPQQMETIFGQHPMNCLADSDRVTDTTIDWNDGNFLWRWNGDVLFFPKPQFWCD